MAKLTEHRARKEYECYKCKRKIQKGDKYKKIVEMYRKPKTICDDCNVPRSELTSSQYLGWIYDLQDNFVINSKDDVESLIEIIEEQKEELEERFENIPEQLQDGNAGTILQDRIEILEDTISQLEQIDFDDTDEELKNKLEEAREILMYLGD